MKAINLTAVLRTEYGTGAAKKLRRSGFIPAILYGHKIEPIALSIDFLRLKTVLSKEASESTLIDLTIQTGEKSQKKKVVLKDIQVDPLKRNPLHADLYEVNMAEEIVVPIAIHLTGKAKGVEEGGVLQQIKREFLVKCLPSEIPEHIEIDVSDLEIGKSIYLNEIQLQEGVEITEDLSLPIVSILHPTVVEEKEEEIVGEVEEEAAEVSDKAD